VLASQVRWRFSTWTEFRFLPWLFFTRTTGQPQPSHERKMAPEELVNSPAQTRICRLIAVIAAT